jgi:hypothetical protein
MNLILGQYSEKFQEKFSAVGTGTNLDSPNVQSLSRKVELFLGERVGEKLFYGFASGIA